ncbi:glycoside hydrolase [Coniochaeta ligniaria NRRL 30616]|uniref:xylan 1,4-beta-xylosidase n=1 Tax=Coniochaeta ligniaria NRRL 30616 TaxID=1408157 RepID=A0A1J7J1C0_9PEZI|nr:glycoside hydrolase [Coniochaeta ligniaria NRRL 30616]
MTSYTPSLAVALLATLATAGLVYPDCNKGPLKSNLVNAPGFQKLGLSAYQWWNEALHGVAHNRGITWGGNFNTATQFPQAITSGAAFDDDLVEQIGIAISTEARAFANSGRAHLDFWTPDVNPFRDPRWGRGHETPGEDALRNGRFAEAFIRGMQGTASTLRVIATCKHFAAYDLEATGSTTRFNFDAKVSTQDLAEYYLPPFQGCARDARAGSVMCSYNAVNGVPACANSYLMQTILRQHWNWTDQNQYIVSDCDAVYYLGNANGGHRYKSSYPQAIGAAFQAGTDNICWATGGTAPDPLAAFNQKQFTQANLDQMIVRQYQALIRAGYFDGSDGAYRNLGVSDVNTPRAQDLALKAAVEGTVLLKNDNLLPMNITGPGNTVAMIGFWASKADEMLGGYSGSPPFSHDPVWAAKQMGMTVNYATGPVVEENIDTSTAVAVAQKSKVIIYFGGIDNTVEKEGTDRTSISWPSGQLALIKKLAGLGKPVIVVKMGTHVDDTPILDLPNVKAIIWAGYPGQDGGTAVMQIITGAAAPAGRLPMTMYPADYANKASQTNMALRPSGSYPGRTYRWYQGAVFPFGHGLHYTNFTIAIGDFPFAFSIQALVNLCAEAYLDRCPFRTLPIVVTNTGSYTSDYVALAFVTGNYGPSPFPIKTLATYKRVFGVASGQSQNASLSWTLGSIARVDATGSRILYPGTYTLLIDQPTAANITFMLTGSEVMLDTWPQPDNGYG